MILLGGRGGQNGAGNAQRATMFKPLCRDQIRLNRKWEQGSAGGANNSLLDIALNLALHSPSHETHLVCRAAADWATGGM